MKLKAQMNEMYRNAYKMMKTAKENNDRDLEMMLVGVRTALLWVQQSKTEESYIDEVQLKCDAGIIPHDYWERI